MVSRGSNIRHTNIRKRMHYISGKNKIATVYLLTARDVG
jgi:hypothetical protein